MSVKIPIYNKSGEVRAWTLVDDDDANDPAIQSWRWCLGSNGYAIRRVRPGGTIRLSRLIMGLEKGDPRQVDHINGDTLDNRRANLRICTRDENRQNLRSYRGSASRFRGVARTRGGRWTAQTRLNHKLHYHGTFDTEEEAAAVSAAFRAANMPYSAEALVA